MQPSDREERREIERAKKRAKKIRRLKIRNTALKILAGSIVLLSANEIYKEAMFNNFEPIDTKMSSTITLNSTDSTIYSMFYTRKISDIEIIYYIDELEDMTVVYRSLYNLDLDKYNKKNELMIPKLEKIDRAEINILIKQYNDLKSRLDFKSPSKDTNEFYEIVAKLIAYRRLLSSDRFIKGVKSINSFSEILVKSIVLDTTGLDINHYEYIETNINGISKADKFYVRYIEPNTGKEYNLKLSAYSCLPYLVNELKELNDIVNKYEIDAETNLIVGNKKDIIELVDQENYSIRALKNALLHDYAISNGKLNQMDDKIISKQK